MGGLLAWTGTGRSHCCTRDWKSTLVRKPDLIIPDGAGLGIEVDEGVIERYPYAPGPWSTFRLKASSQEFSLSGDHASMWKES